MGLVHSALGKNARFSEALALTPRDFDFSHQTLSINKTWDYKGNGGFMPTRINPRFRKIQIDWQTVIQFSELIEGVTGGRSNFCGRQGI